MERQKEWRWGPRHARRAAKKKKLKLLTERHMIEMRTDDPFGSGFHDWTLEALKALARRPRYGLPRVYQIGGMLSRVRAGAKLESLTEDSLRDPNRMTNSGPSFDVEMGVARKDRTHGQTLTIR